MAKLTEKYLRNSGMLNDARGPIYLYGDGPCTCKDYYLEFEVNNLKFRIYHEKGEINIFVLINHVFYKLLTTKEFETLTTITTFRH